MTGVIHTMRGKIKGIDPGTSKAGERTTLKISLALSYYQLQHGDTVAQEIDVENMIHTINGSDMLSGIRGVLGI